jgi:hypothetical protein
MHLELWRAGGVMCTLSIISLLLFASVVAAEGQAPGGAQPTSAVCKPDDTRPRAGSASVAQAAGEGLQHKNWQPIGGLIEFTVNSFTAIDADAAVTTCFRWKVQSGTPAPFVEQRPVRVDLLNGGKVLKVTVVVPDPAPTEASGTNPFWDSTVARAIWLVPLVEVRIVALKANASVADVWTEIGITHPFFSLLLALAVVILAFVVLDVVVTKRVEHKGIRDANWLLRIISTPSATASLSQLQILLWTFAIAGSAIYVVTLSGQLVEITSGTLILLGISGAATLASQAHSESQAATKQADAKDAKEEAQKAQANALVNPNAAAQQAAKDAQENAGKAQERVDQIKKPDKEKKPQWSDLIVNESEEGVREIDVTRVQMLLFTLISASFVIVKVIAAYVIPEIPVGYLTLMGISNGVYVGSKVVRKT